MKISVFGVGYVGLVTGACFSELGNEVLCLDIDQKKIGDLEKGIIPIYEPGLENIVKRNFSEKRLRFTTNIEKAVDFGEIIFIAVGTPQKDYGHADLKFIYEVAETIGDFLKEDQKIIVTKSTVPVGTNKEVAEIISNRLKERGVNFEFANISNPEFLKEGDAIDDFMKPDRIVIGTNKDWAKEKMEALYSPLVKNGHPIFFMDLLSAEMSKYAANTMLAAKISFINQIANLCEIVGADVEEVRKAICADKRIGPHFLYSGPGYGGSCFPKDVQALSALAKKHGYTAHLIEAIETVNEAQKDLVARKIIKRFGNLEDKKVAVWGLAFKPNTDDMRCAPSINLIEKMLAKGAKVSAYDPIAEEEAKKIFGKRIEYASTMYSCLENADTLVIITEWPQFKEPDFKKIKNLLKNPVVFDARNIYSPSRMKELGFEYFSIGRQ